VCEPDLAHGRQNGKAAPVERQQLLVKSAEIRKLHRAGVSKAEIARRLNIGRTSVRRILDATQ
jgi:DNA invertase Pin-like site-specific DNA recombinase